MHFITLYAQSWQSAKLFSSRRNWDSPSPLPAGERGRVPIPTRVHKLRYSLYICALWLYVYLPRRGPYGVSYQYAYGRYDPEVVGGGPPVYGVPASPFHMEYTTATPPAHPRACCQCPDSGRRARQETPLQDRSGSFRRTLPQLSQLGGVAIPARQAT